MKTLQIPENPAWDFWKDGITQSFIHSFLRCREQTRLAFVDGWTSRTTPIPIEDGSCNHWVLEQAYDSKSNRKNAPNKRWVRETIKKYEKMWLSETKKPTTKQLETQEKVYAINEVVLKHYFRYYGGDFTNGAYAEKQNVVSPKKWDQVEHTFRIPYWFDDGKVVPINGMMDGVFFDKRGKLWLFETKNKARIDEDTIADLLPFDLQAFLYMWALYRVYKIKPSGVLYNVVRRPGQRFTVKDTLQTFIRKIEDDISKRPEHYFKRWELFVSFDEIVSWKKEVLDPIMWTIRLWWEGKSAHYLNADALTTKFGRCSLYNPMVYEDFTQCYRRDRVFNELTELQTSM